MHTDLLTDLAVAGGSLGGSALGVFAQPIGTRLGSAIRRNRLRALIRRVERPARVPLRVVIHADVADLVDQFRRVAAWRPELTLEHRIRVENPEWTPEQITAEANYLRTHGGLS